MSDPKSKVDINFVSDKSIDNFSRFPKLKNEVFLVKDLIQESRDDLELDLIDELPNNSTFGGRPSSHKGLRKQ